MTWDNIVDEKIVEEPTRPRKKRHVYADGEVISEHQPSTLRLIVATHFRRNNEYDWGASPEFFRGVVASPETEKVLGQHTEGMTFLYTSTSSLIRQRLNRCRFGHHCLVVPASALSIGSRSMILLVTLACCPILSYIVADNTFVPPVVGSMPLPQPGWHDLRGEEGNWSRLIHTTTKLQYIVAILKVPVSRPGPI